MTFYHATTQKNWDKIQREGLLWGDRTVYKEDGTVSTEFTPNRCTYLAVEEENARYGKEDGSGEWAKPEVLLKIEYDPTINSNKNNYCDGCWQLRVYEPIPLSQVNLI